MKRKLITTAIFCIVASTGHVTAQQRGGPGGPGGFIRMMPISAALDVNEDGEISMAEIENASVALKKLDEDNNGKLTEDELRPEFGRGGPGGFGRGPGGPGGPSGIGGRPDGGEAPNPEVVVARYLSLDKNKDDKLTDEEVGPRMQGLLARADADKDGVATKEELTKLAESEAASGRAGRGGPGGGFGGPGGPPEFGRGPSPEEFLSRALEFDSDKDGQLNKEELARLAEDLGRGGGRGEGAPRGFGRPDRDVGPQSQRPARPE